GARRVMRERRAQAAIVEAARGGILRRGIALSHADVGLVTNVSPDHFGEYGIDDLDGLADTKLSIAAVVRSEGLLVLNADDPQLLAKAPALAGRFGRSPPLGWFALDADAGLLREHRAHGGPTCGVRGGRGGAVSAGARRGEGERGSPARPRAGRDTAHHPCSATARGLAGGGAPDTHERARGRALRARMGSARRRAGAAGALGGGAHGG